MANKNTKSRRIITQKNKADTAFTVETTKGTYKVTMSHSYHQPKKKKKRDTFFNTKGQETHAEA